MARKILIPVDGSGNSLKAVDLAADMVHDNDDSTILLHVAESVTVPDTLRRFLEVERIEGPPEWQYQQLLSSGILGEAERRAKERGIGSVRTVVASGDPAKTIVKSAADEKVDVIVMGSRGLGAIKGFAFGSVSQKVSHLAKSTVITIS